jgi:ABC-type dipeptide/oligopeptide/nickel transport system permease component
MTSYTIRRVLLIIPTVFFALSFLFVIYFILPGDPVSLIASGGRRAIDPETKARIEHQYGLDQPVPVQFVDYWKRTITGDLGQSYLTGDSVSSILKERAPASLRLAFWAILIEIVIGIPIGLFSALRRYTFSDSTTTVLIAATSAVPVFVLGFVLQRVFAVEPFQRGWPTWMQLKVQGIGPNSWALGVIPTGDQWRYLVLPAITLAAVSTALVARMMRGSMIEVFGSDYMRTARAKGLRERDIVVRHGLRNALIPVVTLIGIDFGVIFGAAVLTETVFSWPGIGSKIAEAVGRRDAPVLLGLTLVVVLVYVIVNLAVDLSYAWFDPRIRLGEGAQS